VSDFSEKSFKKAFLSLVYRGRNQGYHMHIGLAILVELAPCELQ
jgi:hypothetical protein